MPLERSMRQGFDLRGYKKNLRDKYKVVRADITPEQKAEKDAQIRKRLFSLPEYKSAKTVLCYVSFGSEADTADIIVRSLDAGKTVAVPRCADNSRDMDFYRIESLENLTPQNFGVLEPERDDAKLVTDFTESICILPGLVFDMQGYRLGYGGGYYDRFLSGVYNGIKIGICYSECTRPSLRRGRYDINCDILITETFIKRIGE